LLTAFREHKSVGKSRYGSKKEFSRIVWKGQWGNDLKKQRGTVEEAKTPRQSVGMVSEGEKIHPSSRMHFISGPTLHHKHNGTCKGVGGGESREGREQHIGIRGAFLSGEGRQR